MDKKQYSTKEILFGLRSESIRIKNELEKAIDMLDYDRNIYKIQPWIDSRNALYFNATLRKRILYIKSLRQALTTKFSISTEVGKYQGEYELLWPDGFPARINHSSKEEFTSLIDSILKSTEGKIFEDTPQYRLEKISYTPFVLDMKSAVNNIFPYRCTYRAQDDTVAFSSAYEDVSSRLIRRILDAQYNNDLLTEKGRKIIEDIEVSTKDATISEFNGHKNDEEFTIEELPNRLVLTLKSKK